MDELASESGVKDKYFQYFLDILQTTSAETRDAWKRNPPRNLSRSEEIKNILQAVRETMPDSLFNPVLSIDGMFGC